jgi:hypothetical protein
VVAVAVAAAALGMLFVGTKLITHPGGASSFVVAGDAWTNPATVTGRIYVLHGEGYDGQFVYRLALDPLTTGSRADGIRFANGAYHQERIVYPTLAWLLSGGGHPAAVLWALIGLNVAGIAVLGGIGALVAREYRRSPWWGLVLALGPATAVALARDLNEIVAMALVVSALWALRRRYSAAAALLLVLAVLTRETTLMVPVALGVYWLWERRPGSTDRLVSWATFVLPGIAFVGWQAFLRDTWGYTASQSGTKDNIGLPFRGLIDGVRHNIEIFDRLVSRHQLGNNTWLVLANIVMALAAVVLIAWFAVSIRTSAAPTWEKFILALAVLEATLLSWQYHEGFARATAEAFTVGVLVLLGRRDRSSNLALLGVSAFGAGLAFAYAVVLV